MSPTELARLQHKLGHTFSDPDLLKSALTHRSYLNEHPHLQVSDNERLEFLGDAVLDFLTAEYLFRHCPEMPEGQLTSLRVALVRTETLAALAQDFDLGKYLRLGRGEEADGGRHKPSTLCATFEALVGAMVLDAGIEKVRRIIFSLIEPLVKELVREASLKDAKTRLQELSQATAHEIPVYETIAESGPDHAKEFVVVVSLGGKIVGQGKGPSKQAAQQAAARAALRQHFSHYEASTANHSKDETACT